MINHQYSKGDLIIGKLGTNPWWPGIVVECNKTNKFYMESDNNRKIFVNFFEINFESWIDVNSVLKCSSRQDLENYLHTAQKNSLNVKYLNCIPSTMNELYNKSWQTFDNLQKLQNKGKNIELTKMKINEVESVQSNLYNTSSQLNPCEICLMKNIEFDCGENNQMILKLSEEKQRINLHFSRFMINENEDGNIKCSNFCEWRYHKRCVISENDMLCSCNKSMWICSICDETINVAQLFVCNNHKCMRSYHRSCLRTHIEMTPDIKQCPLHRCVNCSLDYIASSSEVDLVTCVKCKLAFHNHPDCLPAIYVAITSNLIICQRHLIEENCLKSNTSSFCFSCSLAISDNSVSCKYCLVTYHKSAPCLPGFIELINGNTFVCNGCRFPYARRAQSYVLGLPRDVRMPNSIDMWKLGIIDDVNVNEMGQKVLVIKDGNGNRYLIEIYRTISINLQSLDHLMCFGVHRFQDLQKAIKHHAEIVNRICSEFGFVQNFYRNSFVLKYAGLFPLVENLYASYVGSAMTPPEVSDKCSCTDCCTTNKCPNVATNNECTEQNCIALTKCRNRRFQKRHYPRYRLVIGDDNDPFLILEETVVKDVLVFELVGLVKSKASVNNDNANTKFYINLSEDTVLDCSQFCSISAFLKPSDRPNLQPKIIKVSGFPRIGLFSTRRITKGDSLNVDLRSLYHNSSMVAPNNQIMLTTWEQCEEIPDQIVPDELLVIDLCNNDDNRTCEENHKSLDSLPPLCPECLKELTINIARSRVLIHCRICYTVFHFNCAHSVMKRNLNICNGGEHEEAILNFVCQFCTSCIMD